MGKVSLKEIDKILENAPETSGRGGFLGIRLRARSINIENEVEMRELKKELIKKENALFGEAKRISKESNYWNKRKESIQNQVLELTTMKRTAESALQNILNERNKIIREDDARKKILERKEKETLEKEALLKEKENLLDEKETELEKVEREVKLLNQKRLSEETLKLTISIKKKIEELEKEKQEVTNEIGQGRNLLLEEKAKARNAVKDAFSKKDDEIRQKIIDIKVLGDGLRKKENEFRKREDLINRKAEYLAKEEERVNNFVKKVNPDYHIKELQNKKEDIERFSKELIGREQGIKLRHKTAEEKENHLINRETNLRASETEIRVDLASMKKARQQIEQKQRQLDREIIKIKDLKSKMEKEAMEKYNVMVKLRKELDEKEAIMTKDSEIIKDYPLNLTFVKHLKDNFDKMKKAENELKKNFVKIEEEKKDVEEREESVEHKLAELERIEKLLKAKEKELVKKEMKHERHKDLRKVMPVLEREFTLLTKDVDDITKKLKKAEERLKQQTIESEAKLGYMKDKEIELERKEKVLRELEMNLRYKEEGLKDEEKQLEGSAKLLYSEGINLSPIEIKKNYEPYKKHPELFKLVLDARKAIREGDLKNAKIIVKELKKQYSKIKSEDEEKKRISYDIMDLKTDIELSVLG